MEYKYLPKGVCSREMIFEIDNGIIKKVKIVGGCAGNTIRFVKITRGNEIRGCNKKVKGN